MENSELEKGDLIFVNAIIELRKKYKENRIGKDVFEQKKGWEEIEAKLKELNIDESLIIMDDVPFSLMSESIMQKYVLL